MNLGRFEEERKAMVELLRRRGIKDENVLRAMEKVPRHLFVPEAFIHYAYDDSALPIGCSQTISQPYTVAYMTEALEVKPGDKILEVGTGSGYQAAILAEMGAQVFTIERYEELLKTALETLSKLGYKVIGTVGDGSIGWSEFAPYDGIIVTAAAPKLPKSLVKQLKVGGRLVIPIGDLDVQELYIVKKIDENKLSIKKKFGFKFVPLIGKEGWSENTSRNNGK
ncbi:protein-L-isoaspartate(D-aspartate) O-methyltransferase [Candidatus Chrysopegis kryptomonas]|uniref:Protein-L-isoaspartate O-methyltransferase n=1 Tax=Candidatus Chryseopegocella kryptomonas TaxID=1633643 RepID=A0A0P1MR05_9BACT|nr:protein-L-isoaspartate(D-aspartate) O-methyltransferase [Candidatus Chrysopegis kryptomonas]CUS98206.1 protein-L-isoaspartate(D-aspartate) O-methyltransferase [Candidatus Chrysopegis kryptomonas]